MATNPHFNFYNHAGEQELAEDLILESIQMYGIDNIYITRTTGAYDPLLREDDLPIFDVGISMAMYIKNAESYEGEGHLISKFGFEMRDQITFVVARKEFLTAARTEIPSWKGEYHHPKEGDIVYCGLTRAMYEIEYVATESIFYQLGSLPVWELKCEKFEISNERFRTGIKVVDDLYADHDYSNVTDNAELELHDPFSNNKAIQDVSDDILDFDGVNNPFSPNGKW